MKTETIEEAAERLSELQEATYTVQHKTTYQHGFVDGAKWQQERMYSEEDMREAFKGGSKMCWTDIKQETQEPYYYDFNEWYNQFKKK